MLIELKLEMKEIGSIVNYIKNRVIQPKAL